MKRCLALLLLAALPTSAQSVIAALGHSKHGSAFDTGPREKPWVIEGSYDDFEETELHSTILIDRNGRVHWARTGGDPFSDMAFLVKQAERMNTAALKK